MLDVIVLGGCGGVGSAALFHLARAGANVLGLDRFPPGHDRGSSHGDTRVIRQAYFEHPDYVPLLTRATELWCRLEEDAGTRLFHRTGVLTVGLPDRAVVQGTRRSAAEHGLPLDEVPTSEVRSLGFSPPEDAVALFEPAGGYLEVEKCVQTHVSLAQAHGATVEIGRAVARWESDASGAKVWLEDGEALACKTLVVCAGAWAGPLLAELGVELRILRKHLHWLAPLDSRCAQLPVWFFEVPTSPERSRYYYGFPALSDGRGVKLAEHSGGEPVRDPLFLPRSIDPKELRGTLSFARRHLAGLAGAPRDHAACMYTMSPDEHFIVDHVHPNVLAVAGLSGHGFKFASVLGELVRDLALEGESVLPHRFLRLDRFR